MNNWLHQTVCDTSGQPSVKRVGLLVATTAMAVAVIVLAVSHLLGHDAAAALGAVCVPLAGMNGYSYVGGLQQEKKA